jgi:hypothetical protein
VNICALKFILSNFIKIINFCNFTGCMRIPDVWILIMGNLLYAVRLMTGLNRLRNEFAAESGLPAD